MEKIKQRENQGFCEKHEREYNLAALDFAGTKIHIGICPDCEEVQSQEEQIKQEAKDREWQNSLNAKCRIDEMYFDSSLENFIQETNSQKRAVRVCQEMISTKLGKLIFLGGNGTGKTHLACSVIRELHGQIWSMYEITTRIRASYTTRATENEMAIVSKLASLPALAVDEIGRTKGSEAETNWLSYIIDKRHARNLPLILISNKHTKTLCKNNGCKDCLENYIGNDIMSRLREGGRLVLFDGTDYRSRK